MCLSWTAANEPIYSAPLFWKPGTDEGESTSCIGVHMACITSGGMLSKLIMMVQGKEEYDCRFLRSKDGSGDREQRGVGKEPTERLERTARLYRGLKRGGGNRLIAFEADRSCRRENGRGRCDRWRDNLSVMRGVLGSFLSS